MPIINGQYVYNGIRVYFSHLDRYGKSHVLNLFNWAGFVREAYLVETVKNYQEVVRRPILWVTTKISQEIFVDAEFGDVIEIKMVSDRIKKHSFDFILDTYNVSKNCLMARGVQTIAFVDPKVKKTVGIPSEVMEVIRKIQRPISRERCVSRRNHYDDVGSNSVHPSDVVRATP